MEYEVQRRSSRRERGSLPPRDDNRRRLDPNVCIDQECRRAVPLPLHPPVVEGVGSLVVAMAEPCRIAEEGRKVWSSGHDQALPTRRASGKPRT